MPILPKEAYETKIPTLHKVKQLFPNDVIEDIEGSIRGQFEESAVGLDLAEGSNIAVLVGSRGIAALDKVVYHTISCLKEIGMKPFIVPAMGSHGGGIAEEQRAIIEGYGITEEAMGVPIKSSMETVIIGHTDSGIPVHVDKIASECDAIVPVARVKVHTDFNSSIESGLCKMLAIGLGKHNGCSRLHQEGFHSFPHLIPEVASIMLDKLPVPFGVAIIENAHENVHSVHFVKGPAFLEREKELLALSKKLMPKLKFDEIDVLIVEQMGKDISGAGIDPNITGIMSSGRIQKFDGPYIKRIVALSLSAGTHHNATGLGIADFITKKLYDDVDLLPTYANCIASGNPEAGKIPIIVDHEEEAVRAALQTAIGVDRNNPRVVKIKDTLHLIDIEISAALLEEAKKYPKEFII